MSSFMLFYLGESCGYWGWVWLQVSSLSAWLFSEKMDYIYCEGFIHWESYIPPENKVTCINYIEIISTASKWVTWYWLMWVNMVVAIVLSLIDARSAATTMLPWLFTIRVKLRKQFKQLMSVPGIILCWKLIILQAWIKLVKEDMMYSVHIITRKRSW